MRNLKKWSPLFYMAYNKSIHYSLQMGNHNLFFNIMKFSTSNNLTVKSGDNNLLKSKDFNDQCRTFSMSCALLKKKGKQSVNSKAKLDLRELDDFLDSEKIINDMKNAVEHMKTDFVKNLTLRTNTKAIDELIVDFEGKKYEIQELVQIARKPNYVIINATAFPQAMPQILEAINKSGMNLNPQQDGTKISMPIPKVTKEHREILAKSAKAIFIKCRDNISRIGNKHLKPIIEDGSVTQDDLIRLKKIVDQLVGQHKHEAETMLNAKTAELLGDDK